MTCLGCNTRQGPGASVVVVHAGAVVGASAVVAVGVNDVVVFGVVAVDVGEYPAAVWLDGFSVYKAFIVGPVYVGAFGFEGATCWSTGELAHCRGW